MLTGETVLLVQIALVVIALVPLAKWIKKRLNLHDVINKIPGPKAYPIIGTMYTFVGKKSEGTVVAFGSFEVT